MTEPKVNSHEPRYAEVFLDLMYRQWLGRGGKQWPEWKGPTIFHFTVTWTPRGKTASIDLLTCDKPEPKWEPRERGIVLQLLKEGIEKETGLKAGHFDTSFISWTDRRTS